MDILHAAVLADLNKIRSHAPVVLNVTNFVAMDLTANALLAIGASPIMAHAIEELPQLLSIAKAVVVNIGTLDSNWIESMATAVKSASTISVPVVLDPVGAGATKYRTESSRALLKQGGVTVVRGNASEILSLFDEHSGTKGVDATISSTRAMEVIKKHLKNTKVLTVISGETDYVIQDDQVGAVKNGVPMMTKVTAMGCTASALMGAFLAVNSSPFHAAIHAMAIMGLCAELAATTANGPGTFRSAFLDALANVSAEQLHGLKVGIA